MKKEKEEIPYFIEMRGCINCSASKNYKEKYGNEYGFDHEIIAKCVLMGCQNYGRNLASPFIDPKDVAETALEKKDDYYIEKAKKYVKTIQEAFGKFYDKLGVSLDNLFD